MEGEGKNLAFQGLGLKIDKNSLPKQEELTNQEELEEIVVDNNSKEPEKENFLADENDLSQQPELKIIDQEEPSEVVINNNSSKLEEEKILADKKKAILNIDLKSVNTDKSSIEAQSVETKVKVEVKAGIKVETKEGLERELVEKWANHFLTWEIMDEYALSQVKNKKSKEEKRTKNIKYKKTFKKANRLKGKLINKIIEAKKIKAEASHEEIEKEIIRALISELHATKLASIIKSSVFEKFNLNIESNKNIPELKEEIAKEAKPLVGDDIKIEPKKQIDEGAKDTKSEGEKPEKPKTEKEFFEKYKKDLVYFNHLDGSEITILEGDFKKNEIKISVYKAHAYDKEEEHLEFISDKERTTVKKVTTQELEDLLKSSSTNKELAMDEKKVYSDYKASKEEGLDKKGKENTENEIEKLTELEEKVVEIFAPDVEKYKQDLEKWAEGIFSKKDLIDAAVEDLMGEFVKNKLEGIIKSKIEEYKIQDVSSEKIARELGGKIKG